MKSLVAIFALLATTSAAAQSNLAAGANVDAPRAVVERFVALNAAGQLTSPEGRALFGGELQPLSRPSIGAIPAPDRIVMLDGGLAVGRIPGENESRPDAYFYLRRGEGVRWTIVAIRTFALPQFVHELRDNIRQSPPQARTAELDATLQNIELEMRPDAELHAWFAAHRAELDELRRIAAPQIAAATDEFPRAVETPATQQILARLDALSVSVSRAGITTVLIGGILDNSVGFLHADDPAAVPAIDPGDYIWIEPVGEGWYLFRTT